MQCKPQQQVAPNWTGLYVLPGAQFRRFARCFHMNSSCIATKLRHFIKFPTNCHGCNDPDPLGLGAKSYIISRAWASKLGLLLFIPAFPSLVAKRDALAPLVGAAF